MSAGILNIVVETGATFNKIITVKNAAGDAVDLSNITEVRSLIKTRFQDSTTNAEFTLTVQAPATNGLINWVMSATITDTLVAGTQFYDIEMEASDGTVTRLLEGEVNVKASIT